MKREITRAELHELGELCREGKQIRRRLTAMENRAITILEVDDSTDQADTRNHIVDAIWNGVFSIPRLLNVLGVKVART